MSHELGAYIHDAWMDYSPDTWSTKDGRTYVSIPTDPPLKWKRTASGLGHLVYRSGPYSIVREPYGVSGWSYRLSRGDHRLFGLHSRLKDAKAHAERNAAGQEVVNVA